MVFLYRIGAPTRDHWYTVLSFDHPPITITIGLCVFPRASYTPQSRNQIDWTHLCSRLNPAVLAFSRPCGFCVNTAWSVRKSLENMSTRDCHKPTYSRLEVARHSGIVAMFLLCSNQASKAITYPEVLRFCCGIHQRDFSCTGKCDRAYQGRYVFVACVLLIQLSSRCDIPVIHIFDGEDERFILSVSF